MPFRILADAGGDARYLGIGLADAITTRLAASRQVRVRPTSAVLPFEDAATDPAKVASALRVQHVLLGTIQPVADTYRITVQLVNEDGVATWGHTYDEPRATLMALQDRVASEVAGALRIELTSPDRTRLHVRYTTNPAAYDLYLRGRSLLLEYTEANMREAIAYFERALAMDEQTCPPVPGSRLPARGSASAMPIWSPSRRGQNGPTTRLDAYSSRTRPSPRRI